MTDSGATIADRLGPLLVDGDRGGPAPDRGPALEVTDLSVHFGGLAAVQHVSLTLQPGEALAVIGPNGAGKTTLLNAINGALPRNTTGNVSIMGTPAPRRGALWASRSGLARSFQHPVLIEAATVRENLLLGSHLRLRYTALHQLIPGTRMRREEAREHEKAQLVAEVLGLQDQLREPVSELPYGARKLVDIGRSLMSQPRVLLLDEPTSGLDARERARVTELLAALVRSRQVAIMVVEHHMDVIRAAIPRVVGLRAGVAVADGPTDEVLASAEFQTVLLGAVDGPRP